MKAFYIKALEKQSTKSTVRQQDSGLGSAEALPFSSVALIWLAASRNKRGTNRLPFTKDWQGWKV
jgi:hypothetical protein